MSDVHSIVIPALRLPWQALRINFSLWLKAGISTPRMNAKGETPAFAGVTEVRL
jgi:hypothetical protein